MKRYEITTGGITYKYMGNYYTIDKELKTITIYKDNQPACMFGIQGIILEIRDEEYLKEEAKILNDRAEFIMKRYEETNVNKPWYKIIF